MLYIVNSAFKDTIHTPQHKVAIVSIVIGDMFVQTWERMCRKGWERYAEAHSLDILVITEPLDISERAQARSVAWQKLLILSQPWSKQYERIIWLDADIMVTPYAPNLLECCPDESKVGLSESNDRMSMSEKHIYLERIEKINIRPDYDTRLWWLNNQKAFERYEITDDGAVMYNTGVLLVSPVQHEALFLEVYEQPELGRLYEQPYLSWLLKERGLVEKISARFNWGILETMALYMPDKLFKPDSEFSDVDKWILEYLIRREYNNAYFLHFYGCMGIMASLQIPFD